MVAIGFQFYMVARGFQFHMVDIGFQFHMVGIGFPALIFPFLFIITSVLLWEGSCVVVFDKGLSIYPCLS